MVKNYYIFIILLFIKPIGTKG